MMTIKHSEKHSIPNVMLNWTHNKFNTNHTILPSSVTLYQNIITFIIMSSFEYIIISVRWLVMKQLIIYLSLVFVWNMNYRYSYDIWSQSVVEIYSNQYYWDIKPTCIMTLNTGRIQYEVLTTLPFCFSWIKKFLGQQSKIWVDNLVEKLFR